MDKFAFCTVKGWTVILPEKNNERQNGASCGYGFAVSTGHVVATYERGWSGRAHEDATRASMYTRLYVPAAECKLIPFTGNHRVYGL